MLKLFNVGIPSLQVAGGLMIAMISISMLQSNQSAIHDLKKAQDGTPSPNEDFASTDIIYLADKLGA